MLRLGIIVAAAGLLAGQNVLTPISERPEIVHEGMFGADWYGSVLIGIEKNNCSAPILWTLDGSSRKDEIHFPIRDADHISIASLAGNADGAIAVVGAGLGIDGTRFNFLGIIPAGRGGNTIVRTETYNPRAVTIAPDGVIWTVGQQRDENKALIPNVLKRYSPSGKLLTSEALKSAGDPFGHSLLRSSRDRVDWLNGTVELVEFSLDGSVKNRFPAPPSKPKEFAVFELALGDNLGVVASSQHAGKIWTLDRMTRVWRAVKVKGEATNSWLFGFDGDQLVMGESSKDRGFLVIHYRLDGE